MLKFPTTSLAALTLALTGCNSAPQRADCPAGQVCLEYGNNSEPQTLDPGKANLVDEASIIGDLMTGLTTDGPDAVPVPGAATHWETSPDGLVWTFHLREAKWSDGVPVTADDFVYGLRRTLDPKIASIYAYLLYVIKGGQAVNEGKAPLDSLGVRALDPRTVQITLEHPAPYLPELLKHQSFFPVPKHVVEKYGDGWVKPGRYVSNGAFKLAAWRLGDRITVVKDPLFYDARNVCIDRVNYYPTPDVVSAERRVARGELDINTRFQSNRYERLKQTMPGVPHTDVSLAISYLSFNTRDVAAFRDIRVRRALSMTVDREFITAKLMRAGQIPAYSFVPAITANYVKDGPRLSWAGMPFAQRQTTAKALLAQAGFTAKRPLKLTITTPNNTDTLLLMEAIQADWRAIGVEVKIEQNESGVAFNAYRNRDFEIGSMSWYGDFNDPVTFLGLFKSDTGAQNYGDYKNPAYDALLAAADQEADAQTRAGILARAEKLIIDDEATIPIFFVVNRNLVSNRVTGWTDNAPNFHRTRWMCLRK
ncbi:MAG: peptide ABC transporter substrate-binding protein [Alphaproteobacteria bacterium]|nr:peptide ABC transporter substrate-binding protein [Alphaproteobacteria bacterium]MBU1514119.1 peptide ABC transporter substrate-binding protein [Alphaproteobacteria bacterium]MBU2096232.1 peptide ABC transporter substrate-binding protein [Alphaproteobacteria bacterium]MBU2151186.1 peptide ABC transporter substrate-binding protein [Alphaproteobacteria bacterium]MBU2307155.1 peptide ABC transporter substrate-binding protein [Alphaproteobacteria bacterium]